MENAESEKVVRQSNSVGCARTAPLPVNPAPRCNVVGFPLVPKALPGNARQCHHTLLLFVKDQRAHLDALARRGINWRGRIDEGGVRPETGTAVGR